MNTKAIERIKDYCTEVTQEQWEELVKVVDEVGLECVIGRESRKGMISPDKFVRYNNLAGVLGVYPDRLPHQETIPFPDFLAKLKGWDGEGDPFTAEETLAMASKPFYPLFHWASFRQPKAGEMAMASKPWTPKAGEMVEVETVSGWTEGEYMCWTHGEHWVYMNDSPWQCGTVRPLRPTITREQAEKELNKRIID